MLHPQLPWFVAGPLLGLCVVAIRALVNGRLGVTGGVSEIVTKVSARSARLDWRGFFAIGLLIGGAAFALIAGGPDFHGYGWLTDTFSSGAVIGLILLAAGVLIGYGAKTSGGCTSGNGLSGNSLLSPASFAATATFFATAIVVSFVIEALI
jgi:uncharacterized membrane protein YedE/YeeE